jgi:flagellar protein FliS
MLHDGAIARLREASRAIEEGRTEDRYIAVQKASAIVDALHACLDRDRGGEIANMLHRLYTYFNRRLQQINIYNDGSICDEIAQRLTELRVSWQGIADGSPS